MLTERLERNPALMVMRSPAVPARRGTVARSPAVGARPRPAADDQLGRLLRQAVLDRAGALDAPLASGRTLARTFLDARDPVAAWKRATSSTFAGRRGKNQPTLLVVDRLLARIGEPGVRDELRFTLRRWLSTYSGSRAAAATALLLKELGSDMESVAGPEVAEAPARPARPGVEVRDVRDDGHGAHEGPRQPARVHRLGRPLAAVPRAGARARATSRRSRTDSSCRAARRVTTPRAFIFVMDGDGTIYSASKGEVVHHSSFISGRPAAAAGSFVAHGRQARELQRRERPLHADGGDARAVQGRARVARRRLRGRQAARPSR